MAEFALERFLDLSGAVQLDDLDYEEAARIGITDGEARILRYIADTETHTILYLRDLLAGHSARNAEITAFLSVWVYEELWHGRAIDRFLTAVGHPPAEDRYSKVTDGSAVKELVEAVLSHAAAYSTPKFIATHMAWGAINELTAAATYQAMERRTANPVLATLINRLAKQERKHFAFYYAQAEKRLAGDPVAQKICSFALKRFWDIVGTGVGEVDTLDFLAATLFADEAGKRVLAEAEETIAKLPGLEWFSLIRPAVAELVRNHERKFGPVPAAAAVARAPARAGRKPATALA